ncbi:type I-F CRISPR-associated protein Csy2 [Enterovibrio paralichthyis]|uniref:type I-F CRISPR-associated protein Csy2 n=1 Tax=Enterovibrio paralichthyis TaxID=2853805 RepID=UPI001C46F7EE|nr:type I-F CRISPR-associated protein Csy2 [Enterovibrio paralichthyis]MBV7297714.1 CRISPR-associated protein Csy2 [Enterovibrio paralichthyis]
MTFKELLNSKPDDLNVALRRAFRPLSDAIEISDSPLDAITVLVNLTDRVADQKNLLDRELCKLKLRDEKWWSLCLTTVKFRQSHNVKFPDFRAKGTVRALPLGDLPSYLLSSSKLAPLNWAYANDSKYVNKAAFLTSEFLWDGEQTYLAKLLSDENHPAWSALFKLGCLKRTRQSVIKSLSKIPPLIIEVSLEPNYLPQISLPDGKGSYISLSPVASQSVQSHCYQALEGEFKFSAITSHDRATNMGVLSMSCGGAFRMIRSKPSPHIGKHHFLTTRQAWLTKKSIKALAEYRSSEKWLLPINQLQSRLAPVKKAIKEMLMLWLENQDSAEHSAMQLSELFNDDLSRTKSGGQFAYDPTLTKLFINIFKSTNSSSPKETGQSDNDNGRYLLLPNIRICGASALSTPITVGIPSLMAFFGFVHAFERNIKETIPEFSVESFAICVHTIHTESRGLTKEHYQNAKGEIAVPAIYDNWQSDLEISLILHCNTLRSIDTDRVINLIPVRLARGSARIRISDFSNIKSYRSIREAVFAVPTENGRWLSTHQDCEIKDTSDVIKALSDDRALTVSCVGYHLLEQPCIKPYLLRGYPHAFCESTLGLVKLNQLTDKTNLESLLWQLVHNDSFLTLETGS